MLTCKAANYRSKEPQLLPKYTTNNYPTSFSLSSVDVVFPVFEADVFALMFEIRSGVLSYKLSGQSYSR